LVDQTSFEMLPKGGNLWVKNAAKESALIAVMRKGAKLVIKAASLRGHQSIDTYALGGFTQAMDRLQKECPGK
jgi:invasion protein IalB